MSMFRRPTDDSSDSDTSSEASETEELGHSNAGTDRSNGTEEIVGPDFNTAGTVSSGESISIEHSRDDAMVGDAEHVRNMMLASLLEDFYRTRAAELLNKANPTAKYDRQSPEVRPLAQNLFSQASQALSTNGLLPATVLSSELQNVRGAYLSGFDTFGLQNLKHDDLLVDSMKRRISASDNALALTKVEPRLAPSAATTNNHLGRDLALRAERLSIVPHPSNDMHLSSMSPPHSHYKSSFQEVRLLGRGGFGRVFHTFNVFDKKEYAVKKIPLSVKLSQQYREKGHTELTSVLREVQALAQLDHCNVVRYHATWIEDPTMPNIVHEPTIFRAPFSRQKLIADRPTSSTWTENRRRSSARILSYAPSDGIKFEADDSEGAAAVYQHRELEWSHHSKFRQSESSVHDSEVFTDGMAHNPQSGKILDDPSCYVLHVQMSMYPTTLAQYLSPVSSNSRSGRASPSWRHCFHLVPALRILLGILCGLQYIHARGLVHRDIKPSNIFLANREVESLTNLPDGYQNVGLCPSCPIRRSFHVNPRIGDFGLVAELARGEEHGTNSPSPSNSAVGTEYYRPPPGKGKHSARLVDEKLDVYALGVIFVEMLWCCGTNMERLNLLKAVQKGNAPQEVISAVKAEGHPAEVGSMVQECVEGMVEPVHALRWNCSKVKDHLEKLLARCCGNSEL